MITMFILNFYAPWPYIILRYLAGMFQFKVLRKYYSFSFWRGCSLKAYFRNNIIISKLSEFPEICLTFWNTFANEIIFPPAIICINCEFYNTATIPIYGCIYSRSDTIMVSYENPRKDIVMFLFFLEQSNAWQSGKREKLFIVIHVIKNKMCEIFILKSIMNFY